MNNYFLKSEKLIGDSFIDITNKKILIIGLGGVGGSTFLGLVRTGFKNFIIIDKDVISETNLNRQIVYFPSDIDRRKTDVCKEYALSINNGCNIICIHEEINQENIDKTLKNYHVDLVVDAIDDIKGKVAIAKYTYSKNIPLFVSYGMANRLDPTKIKLSTVNKATGDPLGKKYRYELKKLGIDYSSIKVVYSDEPILKNDNNELNSIVTVTSTAGLLIANSVINHFIKK